MSLKYDLMTGCLSPNLQFVLADGAMSTPLFQLNENKQVQV